MVKVGIMSIGDELMNGLTVDTNSSWIAEQISNYSHLEVSSKITVNDNIDSIVSNLEYYVNNSYRYLFLTGGLGPTHDDMTRKALCIYFNSTLTIYNPFYSTSDIRNPSRIQVNGLKTTIIVNCVNTKHITK